MLRMEPPRRGCRRLESCRGACIDSAQPAVGASGASEFASRLERFGLRDGLFEAEGLVVLSGGAAWTRNVCEETFVGRKTAFILDQFHAREYVASEARTRYDICPKYGLPVGSGSRGKRMQADRREPVQ